MEVAEVEQGSGEEWDMDTAVLLLEVEEEVQEGEEEGRGSGDEEDMEEEVWCGWWWCDLDAFKRSWRRGSRW